MIDFIKNVAAQFTADSLVAIALATACAVAIGLIYYAVLGKAWRQAASMSEATAGNTRSPSTYLIAGACYALLAMSLFGVIWHVSEGEVTVRASLIAAGFTWFGFIVTTMIANHRFQGRPFRLTLIDAGHWLLVIFAQGGVIGLLV